MKKSLLLLLMCIGANATTAWAQDDDVYFVPSEKAQSSSQPKHTQKHAYDTYDPVANDNDFQESNWAEGRGNGNWDVDSYNRRGKNYKGQCDEEKSNAVSCYDQGYADGYEDGKYTQRIVRFYSPRPGIYVSSPYYLDCYDFDFDPWYYGYAGGWAWSGWWGWGSWYGWRPYYSSWHWGWGGWYDPWWGWPNYAWYPHHHWHGSWYPAGSERGPRGGYIAYGGRRGAASYSTNGRGNAFGNRPSQSFGRRNAGRGSNDRNNFGFGNNRPSRSFGNSNRPSRNYGNSRPEGNRNTNSDRKYRENNRSFNNRNNSESRQQRSFSQPSRSGSFNRGGSFGGGSRGGFGGGSRGGFGGGGRGGRR